MIKNRVADLIQERGLNITKVANGTGLSRNSITSIAQNEMEMIRLPTINTLCKYFGITPGEFFIFEPVDIDFSTHINNISYKIEHPEINPYAESEFLSVNAIDIEVIANIKKESIGITESIFLQCSLDNPKNFPLFSSPQYAHGINVNIAFESDYIKREFKNNTYNKINNLFYPNIYKSLSKVISEDLIKWVENDFNNSSYSEDLKEKVQSTIEEYLFVNFIYSDVFLPL